LRNLSEMQLTPQLLDMSWLVKRPIAHRGLHDLKNACVENTSSAFARAIDHDYAIECDLQLTADGEAVVFHDETLDRVMQHEGWVRDYSVQQLKRLDFKNCSDRIQTLSELLEQVDGRVTLVIELKSHFDGDVRLALRALEVLVAYKGPYCLMSFDPDLIAALAAHAPDEVRGITADSTEDPYYDFLSPEKRLSLREFHHWEKTQPHFVSYCFTDLPFQSVADIRSSGRPVISWTIRSAADELAARRFSDQITFEGYLA
jgi:glycerophosphoryl diester phosphodiesterase